MSKYIAAKDLVRAVNALPDTENGYSDTYDKATILRLIEDQPGVYWENGGRTGGKYWYWTAGRTPSQTWGEFNLPVFQQRAGQVLTDIECPQCRNHIYLDDKNVMTTYPVQYLYSCPCGWVGTSARRWAKEEDK